MMIDRKRKVIILVVLFSFLFLCTFKNKTLKIVNAESTVEMHIPGKFFRYFNTSFVVVDFGKLKSRNVYEEYGLNVQTNLKTTVFGNLNPELDTVVVIYCQNDSSDTRISGKNLFLKGIYPGFGKELKIFNAYPPSKNDIHWHTNDTALIFYHKTQNMPLYLFFYSKDNTSIKIWLNNKFYGVMEIPSYKELLLVMYPEELEIYNLIKVKVSKLNSEVGIYVYY